MINELNFESDPGPVIHIEKHSPNRLDIYVV